MLPELLTIAATFWGGTPACGQPQAYVAPLGSGIAGEAHDDACFFIVARTQWRLRGDFWGDRDLCATVVHEYGHLMLDASLPFAAENPNDPVHSRDSANVMYGGAGPSIPACDRWAHARNKRRKIAGRKVARQRKARHTSPMPRKKPQTAATGGSRVLLAARLQTGAGKHADKRRRTRAADKRRAIRESNA